MTIIPGTTRQILASVALSALLSVCASSSDESEGGPSDGSAGSEGSETRELDVFAEAIAPAPPAMLSATGLFRSIAGDGSLLFGDGVEEYEPMYKLWSDGADKTRWVYLPPGSKIDTTDPDHWSFPVGTKFWKEFALDGKRIETRLIHRYGPGPDDFQYVAYWWRPSDAGPATDAVALDPFETVLDANDTKHDIPLEQHCHQCHDQLREHVLGFGAIQLTHTLPGVTLQTLSEGGWLKTPAPPGGYPIPGDAIERNALGYMHANCGNCHNESPGIRLPDPRMVLHVTVGTTKVEDTGAYRTAINVPVTKFKHPANPVITYRIAGGQPATSCVHYRMSVRATDPNTADLDQMPPVATEEVDTAGIGVVDAWIGTLPQPTDH